MRKLLVATKKTYWGIAREKKDSSPPISQYNSFTGMLRDIGDCWSLEMLLEQLQRTNKKRSQFSYNQ
jgi:hypothetical protein